MTSPGGQAAAGLYLGLMSGTSIDAVDAALVSTEGGATRLIAAREHPIPDSLRDRVAAISHSGADEIERLGPLDRELGALFAEAALALLAQTEHRPADIVAIGSHGQTIRHRPPSGGTPVSQAFTLQIGDPNTIAETTGITTVADFRRRDMAAGGEGAPLAPAFHAAAFGQRGTTRAVVNIGGLANVSLLSDSRLLAGFDTGPGNTLLDHWIGRHRGEPCDRDGAWAAAGAVDQDLLSRLLAHPYLARTGPRSTGKEAFNLAWLDQVLADLPAKSPGDVQATLAEFTAATIANAIAGAQQPVSECYLCGGGSHNRDLLARLEKRLPDSPPRSTAVLGLDPDWVEAAAFAWLACRTLRGLAGNAPLVTGARAERILGAVFPA